MADKTQQSQSQTPMQVLVHIYTEAPPDVRGYLDSKVGELINVEMPKLSILKHDGPFVWREDMMPVAEVFAEALEFTRESMPEAYAKLSGTVRYAGDELAKVIDKSIKAILLQDKDANRHAYITILSTHAKLVKSLDDLVLSTEHQQEHESESDRKAE